MYMITAITVSVNYDNLLDIILPQNYKFFKKWYIVTEKSDYKTIEVINKYSFENVEILYFDFKLNATFNKGGGINYALNMIDIDENVLLLDSDIFLDDSFENYMNYDLKYDILYSFTRYDYYSYQNFIKDKIDHVYHINFMGFFQLFKNNKKYTYENSENCRQCDSSFAFKFKQRMLLEGKIIKHLGKDNVNHFGREIEMILL
uniref:Glycosyltransferase 2-like domain-containing protein n=1 Tax=viral metagenome TaxID=1070528 RepID=A0A6C0HAK7_9ZZZZ